MTALDARSGADLASPAQLDAGVAASAGAERLDWLDAARGIGILLVVVGHTLGGLIDSPLGRDFALGRALFLAIYTFHMPLFMMLSGVLVSARLERSRLRFCRRLLTGLIWPYFLWSAVQLSVIAATGALVNQPLGDYARTLASLPWHTVSQFWFLYVLFVLHVMAMAVLGPLGRQGFLLLCLALKPLSQLVALPEVLHLTANHALFYGIGVALMPQGVKALAVDRSRAFQIGLVLLAFVLVWLVLGTADSFDPARQLATAKAAAIARMAWDQRSLPASIAGAFAMVALTGLTGARLQGILAWVGQRSMTIFVLHIIAIAGVRIVLLKLFPASQPWAVFAVASVAGVALPLLGDAVIKRLKLEGWLGLA